MFNFRLKYQYLSNSKNELSRHRNVSLHFVHRCFSRGDTNCYYGFNIYQNWSTIQRKIWTFSSIVYLCQNMCERYIKWKWNDYKLHQSSANTLHQWTLFDILSIATQSICFWFFLKLYQRINELTLQLQLVYASVSNQTVKQKDIKNIVPQS